MSATALYYQANIDYGLQCRPLPEDKIMDMLLAANSRISSLQFRWVQLDKPTSMAFGCRQGVDTRCTHECHALCSSLGGECMLIVVPSTQHDTADDGFIWADDEKSHRVNAHGKVRVLSSDSFFFFFGFNW
jgi:hypothetical protein